MSIVMPIVLGAVVLALFTRRLTWREWSGFALYIVLVLAWYWVKNS